MKYIGIVDWANDDKNGNKIAGVRPLYEVSGAKWSVADTREFLPDGKVFWFRATARLKDLIFFTVKESFNEEKYRFNLDRCDPVREIIDFRNLGAVEEVRKALASGLRYSGYLPDKAYILCKGGLIVGPLKLSRSTEDLLRFEAAQIHEIPCYSTDDTPIKEIQVDSEMRVVYQDQTPLSICSYVDWDSNRNVIKRAVEYAINNSKKSSATPINVKDLVTETYHQLKEGDDSARLSLQINRLKRTAEIIKQVGISDEWASELIDALVTLPTITKELDSIREKTRKEASETIRTELNSELKGIEKARIERKQIENDIQESEKRLDEIIKELESRTEDIDREIEKRIETIINKPTSFIAEASFLKAILPYLSIDKASKPSIANQIAPRIEWKVSDTKISSADDLKKQVIKGFRAISVKSDVGIGIHAALTAGILPILSGFNAGAAIDVYSKIACGGRVFRVSIAPTSLNASDLFSKFDENQATFVNGDGSLLEFMEIAKQNPEPAVVVFEGINKAPTESYFMPILEAIFWGRSLPIYFNSNVLQNFEWSENLFPVATIVEGPTTLPLSAEIWSRSIMLDASSQFAKQSYNTLTEIDSNSELFELYEDTEFDIDHLFEELPEFDHFKLLTNRLINGLGHFYDFRNENDLLRIEKIVVESLILPLIAIMDSDEGKDEAVKKLARSTKVEFNDAVTVRTHVDRIARKIA